MGLGTWHWDWGHGIGIGDMVLGLGTWHGVGDKVASSLLGLQRGRRESVK